MIGGYPQQAIDEMSESSSRIPHAYSKVFKIYTEIII
jgi:hypothetical protein